MNQVFIPDDFLISRDGDTRTLEQRGRDFALDAVADRIMQGYSPIPALCTSARRIETCLAMWEATLGFHHGIVNCECAR